MTNTYPINTEEPQTRVRLSRYDLARIDQLLVYIDRHFKNVLSAEQLAAEADLNVKKLRAGIKCRTGFQLHDYHFRVRVEKSKAILQSTAHPLKVIAHLVGFKNESHFCQKFRQFTEMTPNEFRYMPEGEGPSSLKDIA
jgi:transcriptional regulator GlxA family with amidase domain